MLCISIHRPKSIKFGRKQKFNQGMTGKPNPFDAYYLEGETKEGEPFEICLFTDSSSPIPIIDTTTTDCDTRVISDWITDGITATDLELPPLPDTVYAPIPQMTRKSKLELAAKLIREVILDDSEAITSKNFARLDLSADNIDNVIGTMS